MGAGFEGFSEGTFRFLSGIAKHNDKRWFDEHRDDYDAFYIAPAKALVSALGPRLKRISKDVKYEPKVNGSLFRINRDTRFSKDKSPYKTHLDLWFWEGKNRGWDAPGFFFRMHADELMIGAGMHYFDKAHLDAYRKAVLDPKKGRALQGLVETLRKKKYDIGNKTRTKVPRGFDADHQRAELLLHEGLSAGWHGAIPREARSARLVEWCVERYAAVAPISKWLRQAVCG